MADPLDFTGKVILVTGSSRGIGAEMIKAFGTHGAQCVVNYISDSAGQNKTDAETVARELKNPLVIDCDVTNPAQAEAMMKQIQEQSGAVSLDVLVNNSGIIRDRTIKKMSLSKNSRASSGSISPAPSTSSPESGRSSACRRAHYYYVIGQRPDGFVLGQANYSSSKAAIIALTKVTARELARQNITVNAIAPGIIDVGMSVAHALDEVTENFKKQIPLGRLGDVSEIVNAALFLASPMASYITGHVLDVNGGYYMG